MAPPKNQNFGASDEDWVDDAEETEEVADAEIDEAEFEAEEVEEEDLEEILEGDIVEAEEGEGEAEVEEEDEERQRRDPDRVEQIVEVERVEREEEVLPGRQRHGRSILARMGQAGTRD